VAHPKAGPVAPRWSIEVSRSVAFECLNAIGVILRLVMHEWRALFPLLAQGDNPQAEKKLKKSIHLARCVAYVYWIGILTTAFFGAVKPF
jgi:hypothetical protein